MSGVLAMKYGSQNVPLAFKKESARLRHHEPPVSVNPDTFRELLASSLPLTGSEVSDVLKE